MRMVLRTNTYETSKIHWIFNNWDKAVIPMSPFDKSQLQPEIHTCNNLHLTRLTDKRPNTNRLRVLSNIASAEHEFIRVPKSTKTITDRISPVEPAVTGYDAQNWSDFDIG